jgi:hypothetical protein
MDDAIGWRAQVVRERAVAARSRLQVWAAMTLAAEVRCADLAKGSRALTAAARSRSRLARAAGSSTPADPSAFDRLQAEAVATAGGHSGSAARLLVHRLAQARPVDAAARAGLDSMILGAWDRLERRARDRLGADASPELVARELIRYLGLEGT